MLKPVFIFDFNVKTNFCVKAPRCENIISIHQIMTETYDIYIYQSYEHLRKLAAQRKVINNKNEITDSNYTVRQSKIRPTNNIV